MAIITNAPSGNEIIDSVNTLDSGKQNNLSESQLNAVNSGITSALVEQIGTNQTNISSINEKIPNQASSSNQLADKDFVNSSIQTNTGSFDGVWATYAAIPSTVAGFTNEGYEAPTINNYLVVTADETQGGGTWRYKYTSSSSTYDKANWRAEYAINDTPLTAAQLAALNSGITDTLVTQIGTNQTNIASLGTNKQDAITGAASSITSSNLTANKALVSDNNGKVTNSAVTATELGYLTGAGSNIQSQINSKANEDLDNLSDTGQMVIDTVNSTISNCILDIPQNIKLEINNGVITLKSGCKITKTGSTYATVTVASDANYSTPTETNCKLVVFATEAGLPAPLDEKCRLENVRSGSGDEGDVASGLTYFDTDDRTIYQDDGSGSGWEATNLAYPLAVVDVDSQGKCSFAKDSNGNDMIFNGACFVGHHAVVYPNIKILIPNSFNDDGSLKSILGLSNVLSIIEMSGTAPDGFDKYIYTTNGRGWAQFLANEVNDISELSGGGGFYSYVKNKNMFYHIVGNTPVAVARFCLVKFTLYGSTVTDFAIRQPVKLATTEMLDNIQSQLVVDSTPTQGSTNLVTSGGVYSAINAQDSANTDLSNLSSTGKAKFETVYDNISNCIVDAPQRFTFIDRYGNEYSYNYVLSGNLTDDHFILKSGSKLVKTGTSTYQEIITTSNITVFSDSTTIPSDLYNKTFFVFIDENQQLVPIASIMDVTRACSGDLSDFDATDYRLCFDTATKRIYKSQNSSWVLTNWCYPIGVFKSNADGSNISVVYSEDTKQENIFDIYSFMGHTVIVYPGTKILVPDGVENGRLKSKLVTIQNLTSIDLGGDEWHGGNVYNYRTLVVNGSGDLSVEYSEYHFDKKYFEERDIIDLFSTFDSGAYALYYCYETNRYYDPSSNIPTNEGLVLQADFTGSTIKSVSLQEYSRGLISASSLDLALKNVKGTEYTAGTGISIADASGQENTKVVSVDNSVLINTTPRDDNVSILGSIASSATNSIAIGSSSRVNSSATGSSNSIAIGDSASTAGPCSIAIGYGAGTSSGTTIAIGFSASATARCSIQLGPGTNTEESSFYVATSSSDNWKMLDSLGKIPDARLSSNIVKTSDLSSYLQNLATGVGSLSIASEANGTYTTALGINNSVDSANKHVIIGYHNSIMNGEAGILIGTGNGIGSSGYDYNIAVGHDNAFGDSYNIIIGNATTIENLCCHNIALGNCGTINSSSSFIVAKPFAGTGGSTGTPYKLLDLETGIIPNDRMPYKQDDNGNMQIGPIEITGDGGGSGQNCIAIGCGSLVYPPSNGFYISDSSGTSFYNLLNLTTGKIPAERFPTTFVTTNTDQNITGEKTFVGEKKIKFKQSANGNKLGFTLYTSAGTEKGYLEFNPNNLIDNVPVMALGNYASAAAGLTHVGFRKYSSISGADGAYNLLTPLISDARTPFSLTKDTYKNFYLPLGFTDGTTTITTAKTGVVDLSSLNIGGLQNLATGTDSLGILSSTSGNYSTVIGVQSQLDSDSGIVIVGCDNITGSGGTGSILIGNENDSDSENSIAIGHNIITSGENSITIGHRDPGNFDVSGDNTVTIGYGNNTGSTGYANTCVILGYENKIEASENSIAIGSGNNIAGNNVIGIGNGNIFYGNGNIVLGVDNDATNSTSYNNIIIGNEITLPANTVGGIFLGHGIPTELSTGALASRKFVVGDPNGSGGSYVLLNLNTGIIPADRMNIATSVSSSSTNAQPVGAKLFYDTIGDIESLLHELNAGDIATALNNINSGS